MKEDNQIQEDLEEPPGEDQITPVESNESPGREAEIRLAALTGELESLRVESDRQLESLRGENAAQLAAFCELARSLPGLVPELVGGENLEAVKASLVTAREAYNRIATGLHSQAAIEMVEKSSGKLPGAGGGVRSSSQNDEDQSTRHSAGRGVNLIYQALVGGKSGNLAR